MLSNVIIGIILWPVMSNNFLEYITTSHVDSVEIWRDHKAETWYSEQKFMFAIMWNSSGFYVIDRLSNDTKMNSDYFMTNIFIPFEQMIFPRWRAFHQKRLVVHLDNCSVHTSRTSTYWPKEYGMRHMSHSRPTTHHPLPTHLPTHTIRLICPLMTSTCFLQWKKYLNGFRWLTRISFLSVCKRLWMYWSRIIEWSISNLDVADSMNKSRQWRLRQMINNFRLYWFCSISSDRTGACTYRSDNIIIRWHLIVIMFSASKASLRWLSQWKLI
jgi:hypothetical protein